MKQNRIFRIIAAAVFFVLFCINTYLRADCAVWSDDLDENGRDIAAMEAAIARREAREAAKAAEEAAAASEAEAPESEPAPEAAVEAAPDPNSPEGRAAALGLPAPPDIDINSWEFLLVNSTSMLSDTDVIYETAFFNKTVAAGDSYYIQAAPDTNEWNHCQVDSRIAEPLQQMVQACVAEGIQCYLASGYRCYNEQSYLLSLKVQQVGYDQAVTIVAPPGTSEHQTGLCVDITDYNREYKDSSLEQTATYQWLAAHCTEYGFIVRYPASKSGSADSVTGIIYEPWHFRYVGVEAAKYMTENDLCLEEFVALYRPAAEAEGAA